MFTGLVEEIGEIYSITKSHKSAQITIKAEKVLEDVKLGDSICTNGVCLTVTSFSKGFFTVDAMAETMRRSALGGLSKGSLVNLERALRLSDRLGGHIVSGHIDGTGVIESYMQEDNAVWITVNTDRALLKYIVEKGSIAIDGVSLTVAYVDNERFKVSIIPHTKDATTLLKKKIGDRLNLECDIIGKYIEKLMKHEDEPSEGNGIDVDFLAKHGFA